jgi:DNA-binding beta-propeller fold protein YncE
MKIANNLLIFCIILMFNQICQSQTIITQDYTTEHHKVDWIAECPDGDFGYKGFKKIQNLIFGKPTISINKPMSVIVTEGIVYWITDPYNKSLIRVKNNNCEIPKSFKKNKITFSSPVDLCQIHDNIILFTDSYLNRVFSYSEHSGEIKTFSPDIEFMQPTGIAYSEITREIWVVETSGHRISVFNEQGELLKRVGKRGNKAGEFNYPTFIWIDKLGTIYVIDSLNFRIQIFDKDGNFKSEFGEQGDGTGTFARPKGVAVDTFGHIYIADALFHTVQIFDGTGNYLSSIGSQGREKGEFWMPTGIFIDENNFIYVADTYNSRIQIFKLTDEESIDP